jgi:hypothetical protein
MRSDLPVTATPDLRYENCSPTQTSYETSCYTASCLMSKGRIATSLRARAMRHRKGGDLVPLARAFAARIYRRSETALRLTRRYANVRAPVRL